MAPAAAVPVVPTAASGATQAYSKKSRGSFFHVSVAFYMHLFNLRNETYTATRCCLS